MKMHSIQSRFVIGPLNILFAGVYVSIFQPGNFTGWGSEGVKQFCISVLCCTDTDEDVPQVEFMYLVFYSHAR